ncbi:MAG: hypothetical protein O7H41_10175 [Planctomycetota bacterium]|nr:hypothetical protein [Planctomycetota bacterium]
MRQGFLGGALGSLAVVTLFGNLGLGQAQEKVPKEIRARSFVVVDENGIVRATLAIVGKSAKGVGLSVLDEKGKIRAFLGISSGKGKDGSLTERPVLALFDRKGWPTWETPWPGGGATAGKEPGESGKRSAGAANGKVYAGTGGGHWVMKKIDAGEMILLEDGSLWEISPIDRIDTMLWLPITNITVLENEGFFPYKLVNTDDGESVEAKYIGRK